MERKAVHFIYLYHRGVFAVGMPYYKINESPDSAPPFSYKPDVGYLSVTQYSYAQTSKTRKVSINKKMLRQLISGIDIPKDAYLPTGLLILPINSALNPFLYSNLADLILSRARTYVARIADSLNSMRGRGQHLKYTTTNPVLKEPCRSVYTGSVSATVRTQVLALELKVNDVD